MTRQLPWSQFSDFQTMCHSYSIGAKLVHPRVVNVLGLAGEVGEVVENIKKHWRDGTPLDVGNLATELGDVGYYWAETAHDYGISLNDVVDILLRKLADRRRRNVLAGRGDHR